MKEIKLPSSDQFDEIIRQMQISNGEKGLTDYTNSPGPKTMLAGDRKNGFYGFVQPRDFGVIKGNPEDKQDMNASNLALSIGLAQGAAQFEDTPWMKFSVNGEIIFVPVKPIRHTVSWNGIYNQGAVYGDNTIGVNPPNGRAGDTVSVANNAFLITVAEDHWLRSGASIASVGDTIVTRGFANTENNGEFVVESITDTEIQTNKTLVDEPAKLSHSVYNKKDAVTQNREVTIGDNKFKVQLLKGAGSDPLDGFASADRGMVGEKSQWNNLILPLHEKAKLQDWAYKAYAGTTENWAVGLTDLDLITHHTLGRGSYSWCQETGDSLPARRVLRGNHSASYGIVYDSWYAYSYYGWRPALRLLS